MKRTLTAIVALLGAGLIIAPASAKEASKELAACLKAYHQVHDALAQDDLAAAKKAASDLAEKAKAAKCVSTPQQATELAKSDSLESAREHFKAISEECIKMAAGIDGQYVFTCPMVKADWLQTDSKQVSNPYMGKKMPTCGEIKKS
jgi:acyl-CoA synthetase (AMP-forming)/AMP-acid ligase II